MFRQKPTMLKGWMFLTVNLVFFYQNSNRDNWGDCGECWW